VADRSEFRFLGESIMKSSRIAVVALALSSLLALPAIGQEHRERRDGGARPVARAPAPAWHGEIHRFHEHDLGVWRGGRWFRGPHDGRLGWWWIVGGLWYFYPAPVYPYPDPYQPPVIVAPAEPPPPPQYWYYCPNPQGYYPYVPQCPSPWQKVPAAAPR
jgi:hypothetical protein